MGNVYGGGWAQNGGTSTVTGAVNITIAGDAEVSNVFGGGSYSTNNSQGATSVGSVSITVAGGAIYGNIFAAGQGANSTVTTGNVSVTFTGSNDHTCNVYSYSQQASATTGGDKALTFATYTGALSGDIGGFDKILVTGDTAANLGGTIDNGNWEFDFTKRTLAAETVALTLANGISTEDELNLTLRLADDVPATDWSLASGVGDIASALAGYEVYVGDTQLDFAGGKVVSGVYAGWCFAIEDSTLKFKQLA